MNLYSSILKSGLLAGLAGGFLATLPMTVWMISANRLFLAKYPDPLPPEEITQNMLQKTGLQEEATLRAKKTLSLISHFLYGALIGLPMGFINRATTHGELAASRGFFYGLGIWMGNYLGLLPNLNLYPPATQEPARMNAIMIVGHGIWGSSLGWLTYRLRASA